MKKIIIYSLLTMLFYSVETNALSDKLKQKYPFSVLTKDYGILNDVDLDSELDGMRAPKHFPNNHEVGLYWQSFPREHVTIMLRDIGYSSYETDENNSELTITAYNEAGTHQYGRRRDGFVSSDLRIFKRYQQLVRGQKYICLEGTYSFSEDKITNSKKERMHIWTFEKIKTKRGCDAYFQGGCHYS